jgi:hypothetical protein
MKMKKELEEQFHKVCIDNNLTFEEKMKKLKEIVEKYLTIKD